MNLIGQIGNFIAVYQYEITIALVIVIAVIACIVLVRTIYNIEKNRRNLEELRETITEINDKVNRISLKEEMKPAETKEHREVIYIDNRTSVPLKPEKQEIDKTIQAGTIQEEAEKPIETLVPEEVVKADEIIKEAETAIDKAASESEETIPEVKKYFNRNDFISKNGRKYSKEELEKQIR